MSGRAQHASPAVPDHDREAVPAGAAANAVEPVGGGAAPAVVEPWPRGFSRQATMRISDVLTALRVEFPAISTSKLRFLEDQGLVSPVRTPSGYRQYCAADVERLRYVLREQRDRYQPLRVIAERLATLDAGLQDEPAPRARLAASDGVLRRSEQASEWTAAGLAETTGAPVALVADLVAAGVLRPATSGHFDAWAKEVVTVAVALSEHGVDARHLRSFRTAADRQADLVEQIVAPWRAQPSGREQAATLAAEVGELCARMHTAMVRAAVADLAT